MSSIMDQATPCPACGGMMLPATDTTTWKPVRRCVDCGHIEPRGEATSKRPLMAARSFSVPGTAPSFNEWKGWPLHRQEAAKKQFQHDVWGALQEKGKACDRGLEAVDVKAVVCRPGSRRRDSDNFGALLAKWTQDVLVFLKIIPDDTADRCTFHKPVITEGTIPTTILIISEQARGQEDLSKFDVEFQEEMRRLEEHLLAKRLGKGRGRG